MNTTHARALESKIADRSAVIGVIGLGYVGLPLAMEFAEAGFTVIGYDVSERDIEATRQYNMRIDLSNEGGLSASIGAKSTMFSDDEVCWLCGVDPVVFALISVSQVFCKSCFFSPLRLPKTVSYALAMASAGRAVRAG